MIGHKTRVPSKAFSALLATVIAAAVIVAPVYAGRVLDAVKARDRLYCGVGEAIPGFSEREANGKWRGFDVDFCHALAAAVLGDGDKVQFVPLTASMRFPALQLGQIDVLTRHTSWTLEREAVLKVQFPAVLFYDSQAFLVPTKSGINTIAELNGGSVCVEKGTTSLLNLKDYFIARGLSVNPLVIDSPAEMIAALIEGRCAACTGDASQLFAMRLQASGGASAFNILPELISKEPLCPVVWGGDSEWATIVRWVLYALIQAEETGVTRDNLHSTIPEKGLRISRILRGEQGKVAKAMGIPTDWAVRAVKAAGNYGEMYERNLGRGSPLKIERGLNRLWTDGGLMYAPPFE
ncbi:MAG TPA: amino acid ABC transporter substrate-binding protein [Desulfomonilaceae bacterium]|nr:amino acid ABC transporter substrate-binding protein [Desulfomonilaceae bacterium]